MTPSLRGSSPGFMTILLAAAFALFALLCPTPTHAGAAPVGGLPLRGPGGTAVEPLPESALLGLWEAAFMDDGTTATMRLAISASAEDASTGSSPRLQLTAHHEDGESTCPVALEVALDGSDVVFAASSSNESAGGVTAIYGRLTDGELKGTLHVAARHRDGEGPQQGDARSSTSQGDRSALFPWSAQRL